MDLQFKAPIHYFWWREKGKKSRFTYDKINSTTQNPTVVLLSNTQQQHSHVLVNQMLCPTLPLIARMLSSSSVFHTFRFISPVNTLRWTHNSPSIKLHSPWLVLLNGSLPSVLVYNFLKTTRERWCYRANIKLALQLLTNPKRYLVPETFPSFQVIFPR